MPKNLQTTPRLRQLEYMLWAIGLVCLGIVTVQVSEGHLYQALGRWQLSATDLTAGVPDLSAAPDAALEGDPSRPEAVERKLTSFEPPEVQVLPLGTPLATISIPGTGVDAVILEGIGEEVLRRGVGHFPRTSLPGAGGNIALAAHRDTFFRGLRKVEIGQRIVIETADGLQREYRVESTEVVEPSQVDVLDDVGQEVLTLITCYPFRYVGPAPQRFVVRGYPVNDRSASDDPSDVGALTDSEHGAQPV